MNDAGRVAQRSEPDDHTYFETCYLLEVLLGTDPEAHILVVEGVVIYANAAAVEMFPGLKGEFRDKTFGLPLQDGEIEVTLEDGSFRRIELRTKQVPWRGASAYAVSAFDVTLQREREWMLRLLSRVFEEASDGMTVTDAEGRIQVVNRAFTQTTGYSPEEVVGENPRILKSGRHGADFYVRMWADLMNDGHWEGEIWNKRKNGQVYPEWLGISAIKDSDGKITNYVAVFRDISDDVRLRRELRQAGELQRNMLRPDFMHTLFQVRTLFLPYQTVSADFCDYRWFPEEGLFSGCLFDVMGHGIASGSLVAGFRVLYRQVIEKKLNLIQQMDWLNQESHRVLPDDMFTAAILFEFDPYTGVLRWSAAGIPKLLVCHQGKVAWYTSKSIFFGILKDFVYDTQEITLQKGDWAIFLSDGYVDIFEERERQGSFHLSRDVDEMAENLVQLMREGAVRDDATAMVLVYGLRDRQAADHQNYL